METMTMSSFIKRPVRWTSSSRLNTDAATSKGVIEVKNFVPIFTPHTRPLKSQGQINIFLWVQSHPYIIII